MFDTIKVPEIIIIITSIVTIASILVKLTPSKTDDSVVLFIRKILDFLSLNTKPVETSKSPK